MMRTNWTELKSRFFTYMWGVGYTAVVGLATLALANVDLLRQVINENVDPKWQMVAFTLLTLLLQQVGKWLRNKGLMPLVEDKQKTV